MGIALAPQLRVGLELQVPPAISRRFLGLSLLIRYAPIPITSH